MTAPRPRFTVDDHLSTRVLTAAGGRFAVRVHVRTAVVCTVLAAIVVAAGATALMTGTYQLSVGEVIDALRGQGTDVSEKIVRDIRLPRLLTGVAVGACSGVSGAIFQSISRNVLGSPDVIGFTTGAATGAIVQIIVFDGGPYSTAVGALIGGLMTASAVYLLAMKRGTTGGYRLVLVGIGVGAVLWSVNAILLTRSDADAAVSAHEWLVGTLNARSWSHAWPVLFTAGVLIPLMVPMARTLTLMEMGDDLARQVGVPVERTRRLALFGGVGLIAMATAVTGPIAFVALASPQLVVRLARGPVAPLLPSAFMGAGLLVAADLGVQRLPVPLEVPVGLMTGLVGGVYLIFLLTRTTQV